jgi:hypothetical protein
MLEQRGSAKRTCTSTNFFICICMVFENTKERNMLHDTPTVEQQDEYVTGATEV